MIEFARPGFLGTYESFREKYERPILDAKTSKEMQELTNQLHQKLESMVLRRSDAVLKDQLPPKIETAIHCRLTNFQRQLYMQYLDERDRKNCSGDVFSAYSTLLQVVNHPEVLYHSLYGTKKSMPSPEQNEWQATYTPLPAEMPADTTDDIEADGLKWAEPLLQEMTGHHNTDLSGKMAILKQIIQSSIELGDKLLVFSQSIGTLNCISAMLSIMLASTNDTAPVRRDPARRPKRRKQNTTRSNVNKDRFYQIDGSTPNAKRVAHIRAFNHYIHLLVDFTLARATGYCSFWRAQSMNPTRDFKIQVR